MQREHRFAFLAATLLVACVPFLIHARQCRYYALLVLTQIVLLDGFRALVTGKQRRGMVAIIGALAAQFYCNYMVIPPNVIALSLAVLPTVRRDWKTSLRLAGAMSMAGLLALPWLLYAEPWGQSSAFSPGAASTRLSGYLTEVNYHLMPLLVLAIGAVASAYRWIRSREGESETGTGNGSEATVRLLWLMIPSHLLFLSVVEVRYFRYLMPLIPVLMLLAAKILDCHTKNKPLVYAVWIVLAGSNLLAFSWPFHSGLSHSFESPILMFSKSLATPYANRLEDFVGFIESEAEPGDTFAVHDPEFPLVFLTELSVLDVRFAEEGWEHRADWIYTDSPTPSGLGRGRIGVTSSMLEDFTPVRVKLRASPLGDCRPSPHHYRRYSARRFRWVTIHKRRSE